MNASSRGRHLVASRSIGLLCALFLAGCWGDDTKDPPPNPETAGCLDYSNYSEYYPAKPAARVDWFEAANSVAVRGDRAYVAGSRYGLHVFDVSVPTSPELLSTMPLPAKARALRVAVVGEYVLLCDFDTAEGTIHVVDVADDAAPELVRSLAVPVGFEDIEIAGRYAYVACRGQGLTILDVAIPARMSRAASLDLDAEIQAVAVSGRYACCLDSGAGLHVVDVGDPHAPRRVAVLPATGRGYGRGLDVAGGLAVACGDSLRIADLSDPAHPVWLSALDVSGYDVKREGSRAVVVDADPWQLHEVDLTDPAAPVRVATLDLPRTPTNLGHGVTASLAIDDGFAWVAASGYGLKVVDLAIAGQPALVGQRPGLGAARDVATRENFAFVACGAAGLQVIDVGDPQSPRRIGELLDPEGMAVLAISSGQLYGVTVGGYTGDAHFVSLDVSDPSAPQVAASVPARGFNSACEVRDGLACLVGYSQGLRLVDVGEPALPGFLADLYLPGRGYGVCLAGDYAYVASGSAGLHVVRVRPTSALAVVDTLEFAGECHAVAVLGDRLYAAADDFHVLDLADPAAPVPLGATDWFDDGYAGLVAVDGIVYGRTRSAMAVYDVTDPADPVAHPVLSQTGYATSMGGIALVPDAVVLAVGTNSVLEIGGVLVAWRDCRELPQITPGGPGAP